MLSAVVLRHTQHTCIVESQREFAVGGGIAYIANEEAVAE